MKLTVDLIEHIASPLPAERFQVVLEGAYRSFANTPAAMEILVTDDEEMRTLNRTYRNKDATTDVLSLPTAIDSEQGRVVPETGEPTMLGTIVISLPQATRQIGHFGPTLEDELLGLAEHGLRHLLGHDHDDEGVWLEERS